MALAISTPIDFDTWVEYAERDYRLIETAQDILKDIEEERAKAANRNSANQNRPRPTYGTG